ncbi:conserved hypothetical protein [Tenacibaculum maritimum]|nr:tRNA (5-methylaminomethyl-2-thiouridine)(34)-methyltransferase MnmD [Tenacibaculum maritimum]CAA0210944.1 conserved hypothetical protein [Tenacibaculum maritimum]
MPDWNEQYHSKHGAIQEAYHVFIRNGLEALPIANISILEIGFGTGLNCFITFLEAQKKAISINYTGVEGYPIQKEELEKLNYVTALSAGSQSAIFDKMHEVLWNEEQEITKEFSLLKKQQFFEDIDEENAYDLVYFDAFGATNQPELWTEVIFEKMYKAMKKGGILVTYSAKGSVRRAMQAVGFVVERLPGPPGKREMLRAVKTII